MLPDMLIHIAIRLLCRDSFYKGNVTRKAGPAFLHRPAGKQAQVDEHICPSGVNNRIWPSCNAANISIFQTYDCDE
eukprot:1520875-Pyramimonas_sp.AAC.1